jgi:hypothetical protein
VSDNQDTMRKLRELDEGTAWELPREVFSVEWNPDDSVASLSGGDVASDEGEGEVKEDTPLSIITLAKNWIEEGTIREVIVILNDEDDDQHLLTNLDRNDMILGQLTNAAMNWHNTQTFLAELEDEDCGCGCEGGEV